MRSKWRSSLKIGVVQPEYRAHYNVVMTNKQLQVGTGVTAGVTPSQDVTSVLIVKSSNSNTL